MTSQQIPLHSGFSAASTAYDVIKGIDLSGKTAIVTGGYSGIGIDTVKALVSSGAEVVVPARDLERARKNLGDVAQVTVEPMDLMYPASIDIFAERFLAGGKPLHILINSAGVMMNPLTRDARGYESQLATNHLGHYQLTMRLWPALRAAHGARVVSVSSRGHRLSPMDFNDPQFERREYDKRVAYGQSKTANALFALTLDRLGEPHGIRAFSLHPGGIVTELARHLTAQELLATGFVQEDGTPIFDPSRDMKTPPQGAATSIWCATSPQLDDKGGVYCENSDIAEPVPADSDRLSGVRPWAIDQDEADKLWDLSEKLTGVHMPK
ncbi:oxidoreductase [Dyella sp.]|uniref:oxidoreductase n=1 Tax=Dyella sp. TaxID=1869338 RepID=UPI002ED2C5F1